MDTLKNATNYVAETAQGATSGANKETNKKIAMNDQNPISTHLDAAKDAVSNKVDESTHSGEAEAYKHNP